MNRKKNPKTLKQAIAFRMRPEELRQLDRIARECKMTRTQVIEKALRWMFNFYDKNKQ